MLTQRDIFFGIVMPAVVALVVMALSHIPPWRRSSKTLAWGPAVAIAGTFALAFWSIARWPAFPPPAAQGWLPYFAIGVAVIGIVVTMTRENRLVVLALSIVAIEVASWLMMRTRLGARGETAWTVFRWTIVVAAALSVWWLAMELLARRSPGAGLPILLAFFAGVAALVLVDSGIQSFGQMAGAVAIVVGVMGLAGLWFRNLSLAGGGMLALAILLMGLIVAASVYMKTRDLVALSIAPLMLWAGQLPRINRKPWRRFVVGGIAMLVVLSVALVPALKGLRHTMQEQTESYNY